MYCIRSGWCLIDSLEVWSIDAHHWVDGSENVDHLVPVDCLAIVLIVPEQRKLWRKYKSSYTLNAHRSFFSSVLAATSSFAKIHSWKHLRVWEWVCECQSIRVWECVSGICKDFDRKNIFVWKTRKTICLLEFIPRKTSKYIPRILKCYISTQNFWNVNMNIIWIWTERSHLEVKVSITI